MTAGAPRGQHGEVRQIGLEHDLLEVRRVPREHVHQPGLRLDSELRATLGILAAGAAEAAAGLENGALKA